MVTAGMRVAFPRSPLLLILALLLYAVSCALPSIDGVPRLGMGHGGARTMPGRDVLGVGVVVALLFTPQEEGVITAMPSALAGATFYAAAL